MYVYQSKDPNSLIDRSCSLSRSGSQVVEGADVAKWIKAMDCGSITRGFNPRSESSEEEQLVDLSPAEDENGRGFSIIHI